MLNKIYDNVLHRIISSSYVLTSHVFRTQATEIVRGVTHLLHLLLLLLLIFIFSMHVAPTTRGENVDPNGILFSPR